MADVRLAHAGLGLLGLLALVGLATTSCRAAEADSPPVVATASGIAPPAGWIVLPALSAAARAAIGLGYAVDGVEAWGDPARGCYATWFATRGGGSARALASELVASFTGDAALTEVALPTTDPGVVRASFSRAPYRGRLRARVATDRLEAIACFANQREPVACAAACDALLGAIR